jgi:lipoprotein-anchoring transpeptidase ErfK/SrfK
LELNDTLTMNTIRPSVKNARLFQIAGIILTALILFGCEEYPAPYATGMYPRAAPAGWWNDEGASGSPKIVVHIGEQKGYFYKGKHLVGETTVSTGKPGFGTPPGHYTVLSKDAGHVSTVFGDYVDGYGNVVRSNIDSRKDSQPKGTHFDGARMPYAMFFRGGYAMHQGYVPPFAASHGCIRLPGQMAVRFFENSSVGTPVTVTE